MKTLKDIILNELVKKHRYFETKGGLILEVVLEKDFEKIAENIVKEYKKIRR